MDLTRATYYLAGPMTGYPEFNFPMFERVAELLREQGLTIRSPHEVKENDFRVCPDVPWQDCLKRDIALLLSCDAVMLMPGWERSKGATLEALIAKVLGYPMYQIKPTALSMVRYQLSVETLGKHLYHFAAANVHKLFEAPPEVWQG